MNRKQLHVPSAPRRHSLPVPSLLPTVPMGGLSRSFPEGTETFQKALEDLYISDTTQPYVHYRTDGLKGIQEGDEDEYSSDESSDSQREETKSNTSQEMPTPSFINNTRMDRRRHSMPACLLNQATDKDLEKYPLLREARRKSAKTIVKEHSNYMKEYFIKHGHWPSGAKQHSHSARSVPQKASSKKVNAKQTNNVSVSTPRKYVKSKT